MSGTANIFDQTQDIRPLADGEIDQVGGGLLFAVLGLALCFEYGMLAGAIAHRIVYK